MPAKKARNVPHTSRHRATRFLVIGAGVLLAGALLAAISKPSAKEETEETSAKAELTQKPTDGKQAETKDEATTAAGTEADQDTVASAAPQTASQTCTTDAAGYTHCEDDPIYREGTPICNYLNRGISDPGSGNLDSYVFTPPLSTLSEIEHLRFGLDLPSKHCQNDAPSYPCSDLDDPTEWCIRTVELSVAGFPLFRESGGDGACLIKPTGGIGMGGLKTLDRQRLRSNPRWGLTATQLQSVVNLIGTDTNGNPTLQFDRTFIEPGTYALQLETLLGQEFTRDGMGCANDRYCSHRRGSTIGKDPLMRWTAPSKVNCDQGACPDVDEREPSPWMEIEGNNGQVPARLDIDVELSLVEGLPDPTDCVDGECGTLYETSANGSIELGVEFPCYEIARVQQASGEEPLVHLDLRYCETLEKTENPRACFIKEPADSVGTIICENYEDPPHFCDEAAFILDTDFQLAVEFDTPYWDVEGGVLSGLVDALCILPDILGANCSFEYFANKFLRRMVESNDVFGGLSPEGLGVDESFEDGCPLVATTTEGGFFLDYTNLDPCPVGNHIADCIGVAPMPTLPWNFMQNTYVIGRDVPQQPGDPVMSMAEVDANLQQMCALQATCLNLNLNSLPLQQLFGFDLFDLDDLLSGNLAAVTDLDFLLADIDFRRDCLAPTDPQFNPNTSLSNANRESMLQVFKVWYENLYAQAHDEVCALAPGFEEMLPAIDVELRVSTGAPGVANGFAFVNFQPTTEENQNAVGEFGCFHRQLEIAAPNEAPECDLETGTIVGDPSRECGTMPLGPCVDMQAKYYNTGDLTSDIDGVPYALNDRGLHPNGNHSWHHRCFNHADKAFPMVCVTEKFPGAGNPEIGVCKICGTSPDESESEKYTMVGCPPEDGGCPQGLSLHSDGLCWDELEGSPDWMCDADCKGLYGSDVGYCMHGGPWVDLIEGFTGVGVEVAGVTLEGTAYTDPICADWSCDNDGLQCALNGQACGYDACVDECSTPGFPSDCPFSDPTPAYPAGFICSAEQTCVLP